MKNPAPTLLALVALISAAFAATTPPLPPDLTKGERDPQEKRTYNLGATGMRGWIYTKAANNLDATQGRTTTAGRQILVTHVGAKSPADGVMQVDDIILGVNGKRFDSDARQGIARAIQEAEKAENGGILKLIRWRAGTIGDVQIKLKVMGSYSDTAPYDCPKSRLILTDACKALEKEPLKDDFGSSFTGLALLATGNPEYLPKVRDFARLIAAKAKHLEGCNSWDWGYRNLFLCEYYLLTNDKEVLPAITEYTVSLAKGQGMYGTFGHGGSVKTADGKLHGAIPPYGPVNQAGLIANMAIVMGKKCGVRDPEIDPAIERSARFFGYYVDKGAIPYGEHAPWMNHDNNGKNAMAAMLYALQGNHLRETRYYAKMATAAYQNREYGHTGQGFSYLWSALGANVGGPAAVAAFVREASWHLDLARRCDGSFTYDGGEQYGPGATDDNTYYGNSSYAGISPTATYVLTYSLPLRKLCITGRDPDQASWLDKTEVAEAIASGRFDLARLTMSPDELLAALGDWSPVVRSWAAEELAKRPDGKQLVAPLIAMAEGPDARKRQGACEALGYIKSPDALPVFVRLLKHEDRWLRSKAANALTGMGDAAKPFLPDILQAAAGTAEPMQPIVWADPVQLTQVELASTVFGGLLRKSLDGVDRNQLYPVIRAVARNANGQARSRLDHTFENLLTADDVQTLAPDILAALAEPAPADTMYADYIRLAGLKVLAKYHFREGIRAGVEFARTQGDWGSQDRMKPIMAALKSYGMAARDVLPDLKALIVKCDTQVANKQFPDDCNKTRVGWIRDAIEFIEAAKDQPELRTIAK